MGAVYQSFERVLKRELKELVDDDMLAETKIFVDELLFNAWINGKDPEKQEELEKRLLQGEFRRAGERYSISQNNPHTLANHS